MVNLAADIFLEPGGRTWAAVITRHPDSGGPGSVVWSRCGMRTEHNATVAMDAAWQRLLREKSEK